MGGAVRASDVETVFEAQDRLHVVYPKGCRTGRLKSVTHLALTEFPLILMQRDTSVRAIVGSRIPCGGVDAGGHLRSDLYDDGGRHGALGDNARRAARG